MHLAEKILLMQPLTFRGDYPITDLFFSIMKKVNPKVVRYYEHKMAVKVGFHEDFDRADALVKPFLAASQNDKSHTFRQMSEIEMRLVLRSLLYLVERPFVNDDPIAGTAEHRRIAIETSVRLLGQYGRSGQRLVLVVER